MGEDLIRAFGRPAEVVAVENAEADRDPQQRFGNNAVYAIDRAKQVLGWEPRPLSEQVDTYLQWAESHPEFFRPAPP